MALSNYTGTGATATAFTGLATVGNWEIQTNSGYGESVDVLPGTHLGTTTFREMVPGYLRTPDQITFSVFWNWAEAFPAVGTVGTLTFDMPDILPSQTTQGNITGSGFMVSAQTGQFVDTDRSTGTLIWQYDGKVTEPTYTATS